MIAGTSRQLTCSLLISVLLSQMMLINHSVAAQSRSPKSVIVNVGQPNIWSLEQAHYLLARIRERNLGIRNPSLTEDDLNPNLTNATRLDAFRSLFELGFAYSQGVGKTNEFNQRNLELNQTRRQELFARRSNLFDQKNGLLADKGKLNAERKTLEASGAPAEEIKQKDGEISANDNLLNSVDLQIANIDAEIKLVGSGDTALKDAPSQSGPGVLSGGVGERIGKALADEAQKAAVRNSRLAASIKVDNYVQMQYELLAKQLTLLRDDVGPNERLVFLELPTSIYATPEKGNERTAQCWWKIVGYERANRFAVKIAALEREKEDLEALYAVKSAGRSLTDQIFLGAEQTAAERQINEEITDTQLAFIQYRSEALQRRGADYGNGGANHAEVSPILGPQDISDAGRLASRLVSHTATDRVSVYLWPRLTPATRAAVTAGVNDGSLSALIKNLNDIILSGASIHSAATFDGLYLSNETEALRTKVGRTPDETARLNRLLLEAAYPLEIAKLFKRLDESKARTVDLIPRQSSLNVNDIKEVVRERGIKFVWSFLLGFGGSVNYQQRREQFEQFQQQEVYAAGFGKGESVFGWTFNPMPGTKRLAPGVRTTYAVMVVPRDATKIRLRAIGRDFESDENQVAPTFDEPDAKTITLEIPDGPDEGFFVSRIDYPPVAVNQRSVVVLRGDFSNQTGVLIDGTPLSRTVGVASPWLGSEREAANAFADLGEPDKTSIKGYFEVINANQIIMVFLMPKDYKGTPQITVVSPARARALNNITMNINGARAKLADVNNGFMIGSKAPDPKVPLAVDTVEISQVSVAPPPAGAVLTNIPADINVTIKGIKKEGTPVVYLNAAPQTPTQADLTKAGLYVFRANLPLDREKLTITVVQGEELNTRQIDNPVYAKVSVAKIMRDDGDLEDPTDDTAIIALEGQRVQDLIVRCDNCETEFKANSFNQAVIYVSELAERNIISLADRLTGQEFAPIRINRRAPKKPKPAKDNSKDNKEDDTDSRRKKI